MKQHEFGNDATRSVAVLGASTQPEKFGNRAVRAYRAAGWRVYPIHPSAPTVAGVPAFRSILEVPEPVYRATVYLPPEKTLAVLQGLAAKGVREVFLNPGSADARVIARGEELGLVLVLACSILDLGRSPGRPD